MRRFTYAVLGGAVCVCCVLPSYDLSDTRPGGGGGDSVNGGTSGHAGKSSTTNVMGGSSSMPNAGEAGAMEGPGGEGGTETGGAAGNSGSGGVPGGSGGVSGGAGGGNGGGGTGGMQGCPVGVVGHCDVGAVYPTHTGFTLALVEDFPAPLDLDNDPVWTWSDGSPLDGQTRFYEDHISFANGRMLITADLPNGCAPKTTNAGCIAAYSSYAEALSPNPTASIPAMTVRSGELRTKYNNYRYGYYEAKLVAPIANPGNEDNDAMSGSFLANLSLYRTPRNVAWQEYDFELGANHHNSVSANAVNAVNGSIGWPQPNAQNWTTGGGAGYVIYAEHTYAMVVTSTGVDWILDGKVVHTWGGSGSDPLPTLSMKILMNLWVFSGNAFGDPALNQYPLQVSYDYFHFYKWNQDDQYPCSPTPGCLPAADKVKSSQNNPKEVSYGM